MTVLVQPHCRWRSIGVKLASGGLSKRKRHWICLTCKAQKIAPKHPERALAPRRAAIALADAERAAGVAEGWEVFRDPGYFDMWCVRSRGEREFGRGFHVATEQEAFALSTALDAAVRRPAGVADV